MPVTHPNLTFQTTNVTSWADLSALFKLAITTHGRIDHVFTNAGITSRTNYLVEHLDEQGNLLEPDHLTIEINLRSVVNTTSLALHYLRKQAQGGSIVLIASASSFQRFRAVDYTTAKHGVLGLMRGLAPILGPNGTAEGVQNIRINAIAPSWTNTGIVPGAVLEQVAGIVVQQPVAVARSVACLFADEKRHGQLIYSVAGRFSEIEERLLLKVGREIVGENGEELVLEKLEKASLDITAQGAVAAGTK